MGLPEIGPDITQGLLLICRVQFSLKHRILDLDGTLGRDLGLVFTCLRAHHVDCIVLSATSLLLENHSLRAETFKINE